VNFLKVFEKWNESSKPQRAAIASSFSSELNKSDCAFSGSRRFSDIPDIQKKKISQESVSFPEREKKPEDSRNKKFLRRNAFRTLEV